MCALGWLMRFVAVGLCLSDYPLKNYKEHGGGFNSPFVAVVMDRSRLLSSVYAQCPLCAQGMMNNINNYVCLYVVYSFLGFWKWRSSYIGCPSSDNSSVLHGSWHLFIVVLVSKKWKHEIRNRDKCVFGEAFSVFVRFSC